MTKSRSELEAELKILKQVFNRMDEFGTTIYRDIRDFSNSGHILQKGNYSCENTVFYMLNQTVNEHHGHRCDLASQIEDILKQLEDKPTWQLCNNNCGSPPCYNLCDPGCPDSVWPREKGQYEYCPECIAAYERGLTYSDLSRERRRAAEAEKEKLAARALSEKILKKFPEQTAFWVEQDKKRKSRLEQLRRESEELME